MTFPITRHAADRWISRVGEGSLSVFLDGGELCRRAPRWTRLRWEPLFGERYVTNDRWPGVCAVISADNRVLTVLTRAIAAERQRAMAS